MDKPRSTRNPPPFGSPEHERQQVRAARDAATATGFHARGMFEMLETVSPYAARLLLAKLTGDDTTVGAAISFLKERYDTSEREAALVLGMAIGERFHLAPVEKVGLKKLQVCQAPRAGRDDAICGRLFLKVTRKEYCSSQCQKRTWARQAARNARERFGKKEIRHGKTTRTR